MAENVNVNAVRHPEWPEQYRTWMTLVEAADVLDIRYPGYVRTLCVGKGDKPAKIHAQKLTTGTRDRWALDPASVLSYRDNRGSFGDATRAGKRNAIVQFDSSHLSMEQIEEALTEEFGEAILNVKEPYRWKGKPKETDESDPEWHVAHVEDLIPEGDENEDDEGGIGL